MINKTWDEFLQNEFNQDYFVQLSSFLADEYKTKEIYPCKQEVFASFYYCDLNKVKVVILGQDPYHEPGQACGMCFAVKPGIPLPPSLKNIYKEIENNLNIKMNYSNGFLQHWADQGVLLLNSVLTVQKGMANSHKGKGWEVFTDHVIEKLNSLNQPIVFLLWGGNAKAKMNLLTNPNHLALTAAHPSPLSAYNGFFGCDHFSKCNEFLISKGLEPIDWKL